MKGSIGILDSHHDIAILPYTLPPVYTYCKGDDGMCMVFREEIGMKVWRQCGCLAAMWVFGGNVGVGGNVDV